MQPKKSVIRRIIEAFLRVILIGAKWNKYSPLQIAKHKEEPSHKSNEEEKKHGDKKIK